MKEAVALLFGFGLFCNALLFVPQAVAVWRKKTDEGISLVTFGGFSVLQIVGVAHGLLQHDMALTVGMIASLLSCGTVTVLTLVYRVKRLKKNGRSQRAIEALRSQHKFIEESGLEKLTDEEMDAEIAEVREARLKKRRN